MESANPYSLANERPGRILGDLLELDTYLLCSRATIESLSDTSFTGVNIFINALFLA